MKDTLAHRLPGILLVVVTAAATICGLPPAMMFLVAGIAGGSAPVSLALGAPALIADAVAVWLCFLARRPGRAGRAWLLAVMGTVLVVGAATPPVTIVSRAVLDEWRETQPGGRGYHPR